MTPIIVTPTPIQSVPATIVHWQDAESNPPDCTDDVLVIDGWDVRIGYCRIDVRKGPEWWVRTCNGWEGTRTVTHWAPLPWAITE